MESHWSVVVVEVGGRRLNDAEIAALGPVSSFGDAPLEGLDRALRRAGYWPTDLWARGSTLNAKVERAKGGR
jgi:hypothetical protein